MAEMTYQTENIIVARSKVDWGAIWAGLFTFVGIWSVFGVLGMAIFATAANPNAARPVMGMSVGMSIWAIVLTIIAMYVAGVETGRLAMVVTQRDRLVHGMIMFGLSVTAVLIVATLAGAAVPTTGTDAGTHSAYVLSLVAGAGWVGFLSLFLGWLAAMGGASSASPHKREAASVQPIRHAA